MKSLVELLNESLFDENLPILEDNDQTTKDEHIINKIVKLIYSSYLGNKYFKCVKNVDGNNVYFFRSLWNVQFSSYSSLKYNEFEDRVEKLVNSKDLKNDVDLTRFGEHDINVKLKFDDNEIYICNYTPFNNGEHDYKNDYYAMIFIKTNNEQIRNCFYEKMSVFKKKCDKYTEEEIKLVLKDNKGVISGKIY